MFYRTKIDKNPAQILKTIKNAENCIKKCKNRKKNKKGSPDSKGRLTNRANKQKQSNKIQILRTEYTDKSASRSKQKQRKKGVIYSNKDNNLIKSTKIYHSPSKIINNSKKNKSKSKSKSPTTSRKNTTQANYGQKYSNIGNSMPIARELFKVEGTQKSPIKKQRSKSKTSNKCKRIKDENIDKMKKGLDNKLMKQELNSKDKYCEVINIDGDYNQNQLTYMQDCQQKYNQHIKKYKKTIPQIKTIFSSRKKSCIDQSLLSRLENHKQNKSTQFIQTCILKSIKNDKFIQPKQEDAKINVKSQIIAFRQEQQKRWRSMLDQIKSLKNQERIQQKIDQLIAQITQNYNNLANLEATKKYQQQKQPIIFNLDFKQNSSASLPQESDQIQVQDKKVQQNLAAIGEQSENNEVVVQSRSHIISLQDFFNFTNINNNQRNKRNLFEIVSPTSKLQPKNEAANLQQASYAEEQQCAKNETFNVQIDNIDVNNETKQDMIDEKPQFSVSINGGQQNEKQKNNLNKQYKIQTLTCQIEGILIDQISNQLIINKRLLQFFLSQFNTHSIQPQLEQYPTQPSSNQYIFELLNQIIHFLFTYYRQYTLKQISFYYECKPLQILRYVRAVGGEEEQASYQIQNQKEIQIPFFNLNKIYQFQTNILNNESYQPGYFSFNQCIYDAFNDAVDNIRPYGAKGKSIFTLQLSHAINSQSKFCRQIERQFKQMVEDRSEFNQDMLGQELIHGEEGNFEISYFVSLEVTEAIYNQAVIQIYKIFRRFKFQ